MSCLSRRATPQVQENFTNEITMGVLSLLKEPFDRSRLYEDNYSKTRYFFGVCNSI